MFLLEYVCIIINIIICIIITKKFPLRALRFHPELFSIDRITEVTHCFAVNCLCTCIFVFVHQYLNYSHRFLLHILLFCLLSNKADLVSNDLVL